MSGFSLLSARYGSMRRCTPSCATRRRCVKVLYKLASILHWRVAHFPVYFPNSPQRMGAPGASPLGTRETFNLDRPSPGNAGTPEYDAVVWMSRKKGEGEAGLSRVPKGEAPGAPICRGGTHIAKPGTRATRRGTRGTHLWWRNSHRKARHPGHPPIVGESQV
jgi:hypothetical protein